MLASANRTRYPKVFPEFWAIDGDPSAVVAGDSTARMLGSSCFARGHGRCRTG